MEVQDNRLLRFAVKDFLLRFFSFISLIFLLLSCEETIEPYELDTAFKGSISCSMDNVVIRPDHSVWIINNDYVEGKIIVNPIATRFNKFRNAGVYEVLEGLNLVTQTDGNVWYWGQWMLSSCIYQGTDAPIIITKLPNVISAVLKTNEIYLLNSSGSVFKVMLEYCKKQEFQIAGLLLGLTKIKKITEALALDKSGKVFPINDTQPESGGYISGLEDVLDIETSFRRSYIIKNDGTVWGWGRNWNLDLGSNDPNFIQQTPSKVNGLSEIEKISSNGAYSLALKKDGSVWYWGYSGRDLNNDPVYSPPNKIEGLDNIALMEAGFVSFFIKNDGSVWYYDLIHKKLGKIIFPNKSSN